MFDNYMLRKLRSLERARNVAGLAKLLRHEKSWVVSRSAGALVDIGGRPAAEALLTGLDEAVSSDARVQITYKLGEVGDPAAVDRLVGLLHGTAPAADGRVADAAAEALEQIGGPVALAAFVDALVSEGYRGSRTTLRKALRTTLRTLRGPATTPAIDRVVTRDAGEQIRRLFDAGDYDGTSVLLRRLADGAGSVRTDSGDPWSGGAYTKATAQQAAAALQRLAVATVRSRRDPDDPAVSGASAERELRVLFATLDGFLSALPDHPVVGPHPLTPEPSDADPLIVDAMTRLLRSDDAESRSAALTELGQLGGPAAVAAVRDVLDDESPQMRRAAVIALHRMGAVDSVATLRGALDDEFWSVRLAAVAPLRELGGPEAVAALRGLLDDESPQVRKAAVAVLAEVAPQTRSDVFSRAVRDPHGEVRWRAACVIADLNDPQLADRLAELLVDPNAAARTEAGAALHRWGWVADDPEQRIYLDIVNGLWDEVAEAGAAAAGPLVHMLTEVYAKGEASNEQAVPALERILAQHPKQIPHRVLEAGKGMADPLVATDIPDVGPGYRRIDASHVRQLCEQELLEE